MENINNRLIFMAWADWIKYAVLQISEKEMNFMCFRELC